MKIFHCYVKILLGSIRQKSLYHYNDYNNNKCAAKTTTTKTSRTSRIQMVDIFPNHPMWRCHALPPDNAKGRIARHLRVILWVLQEREIFQHEGCFNICFTDKIIRRNHSAKYAIHCLIYLYASCICILFNSS